jgi:uncharacterized membrane protein
MCGVTPDRTTAPTLDDPALAAAREIAGGRLGRRALPGTTWWSPLRVAFVLALIVFSLGVVLRAPCSADGFVNDGDYVKQCYSDIGVLYTTRGLDTDTFPYVARPEGAPDQVVEYPVLQGFLMWAVAFVVPNDLPTDQGVRRYYALTSIALFLLLLVTVWATLRTARTRPWDAVIVAAAPSIALVGTLNWDMLPLALLALAILAWSREHPWLAGVLLGLGGAAKLYPLLVIGPLFILCLRAGKLRAFGATALAAAGAWALVNIPIALQHPEGWARFYELSRERPFDFGSIWLGLDLLGLDVGRLPANTVSTVVFLLLCANIALLGLSAPRRPRFAQLALLVIAAFLITNKVYSPQYVLWLLPLVALARPRWRDVLIWQGGQAIYYVGIWLWLNKFDEPDRALSDQAYGLIVLVHVASTLWICGMVVRDILRPEHDPVRSTPDVDGELMDDPTGGVLDRAPDRPGFPWPRGLWGDRADDLDDGEDADDGDRVDGGGDRAGSGTAAGPAQREAT